MEAPQGVMGPKKLFRCWAWFLNQCLGLHTHTYIYMYIYIYINTHLSISVDVLRGINSQFW